MKKFRFSLETVLDFKQQALDALQVEHGAILAQIQEQELEIDEMEAAYRHLDQEFNRRKREGISVVDAMKYDQYLRAQERELKAAYQRLAELRKKAEEKRQEVVEAKKETSSIEKLREKKLEAYNKAVQKSEEAMIDELVSTKRVMAAQGARM